MPKAVVTLNRRGAVAEERVDADGSLRFVSELLGGGKATILGAFAGDCVLALADKATMTRADPSQRVPAKSLPASLPAAYGTVAFVALTEPFEPGRAPYAVQDLPLDAYWQLVAGRLRTVGKKQPKAEPKAKAEPKSKAEPKAEPKAESKAKAEPLRRPPMSRIDAVAPPPSSVSGGERPRASMRASAAAARETVRRVVANPALLRQYDEAGYDSAEDSDFSDAPLPESDEDDITSSDDSD